MTNPQHYKYDKSLPYDQAQEGADNDETQAGSTQAANAPQSAAWPTFR